MESCRKRRRHRADLKAQILAECDVPGASVTEIAMTHGFNPNKLHGWRKLAREAGAVAVTVQFVPLAVAPVVLMLQDTRPVVCARMAGFESARHSCLTDR